MTLILLVEDDTSLGATLKERLERERYTVEWRQSMREALAALRAFRPALAIIDVGLPDGSGFDLAGELKAYGSIPVIFCTAMNSAEHRLMGYEQGAEEYIPKPFHLRELLLRVQRVLERARVAPEPLRCGQLLIDRGALRVVLNDGKTVQPSKRDFKILEVLVSRHPEVVTREELLRAITGSEPESELPTVRVIDNAIVRLRQLLNDGDSRFIKSVRGVGYQWLVPPTSK